MKRILAFVLAGAMVCALGLAAGDIVSKSGTARNTILPEKSQTDSAGRTPQKEGRKDDPWGVRRWTTDQTKVESVGQEKVPPHTDPLTELKDRIQALETDLLNAMKRNEDLRPLRNQLDELYSKLPKPSASAKTAASSSSVLAKSPRMEYVTPEISGSTAAAGPVPRETESLKRETGVLSSVVSPRPEKPFSAEEAERSKFLPDGTTLSTSSAPASPEGVSIRRMRTPRTPPKNNPASDEILRLQRQAEELQAAGGDVTPIKERMNALIAEINGQSSSANVMSVETGAISTAAHQNNEELVPALMSSPLSSANQEVRSLLEQRKQTEMNGGDVTEIDRRLTELGANRGRESLDDNGGVTFNSSHAPRLVWHFSCVEDSIAVSNLGPQITDVEVQIDTLTFSYDTDLDIVLISPAGDTCTLSTDNGGTGDNYFNTRFDDDGACIIGSAGCNTAPFTGTFRPEELLSTFDGENPNGVWRLRVCSDDDNGDGYLRRWRLQICVAGDSCGDAIPLSVPGMVTGNTCGYLNNYDCVCPYTGSLSRDAVYSYTSPANQQVTFGLCRSGYDTKLYIYDGVCSGTPIACNDDMEPSPCPGATGSYRSLLPCVPLQADHTYYVVVDGYGGACGDYVLETGICPPCTLTCLATDTIECAEIPDTSHYRLDCDGGCNSVVPSYETIQCGDTVCGWGFTYVRENSSYRDTDWYRFTLSERSRLKATVYAEFNVAVYILNAACPASVLHSTSGFACDTTELSVVCMDAGTYTLFVAPSAYDGVPVPLTYRVVFDCEPCPDGVDCSDPVVLSAQYITMASQTTCWYGADYNTTCLGNYDNGEDIVCRLTLSQTGDYAIWMDPRGTSWTGFLLDDHCPPDGGDACIFTSHNSGSLPYGVSSQHLTAGTYYLMMDTWAEPICIPEFDFAVGRVYTCVSCGLSDRIECEETVDSTNAWLDCDGGCNNQPNGGTNWFGFMSTYDTLCGKAFTYVRRGNTFRDTDWHNFSLVMYDTIRISAVGEFPLQLNLMRVDSPCVITSIDIDEAVACDTAHVSAICLEPGVYTAFVAPSVYTGIPYPMDYRLWIDLMPCPPGQDCHTPIDITNGATVPALTTQGLVNDYSNTCLGNYDGGADIIFKWRITEEGNYKIKINPYTTGRTGVLLDDNCPPDITTCIANHTNIAAAVHGITCRNLTPGIYYIMVDTYPPTNYIPYFNLYTGRCLTCVSPQAGDTTECAETADSTNTLGDCDGGCNLIDFGQPARFDTIACGQTIAGRCFTYVSGPQYLRDTDWFRFDVASPESVRVSATAEFPLTIFILELLNDSCSFSMLYWVTAQACSSLEFTTACLDTGAYVLWVGPSVYEGIPDPADYRVTLACFSCLDPGTDCITAIPVTDDTTLTAQTTCGLGHDYESSCMASYSEGEDILYQWTVTQEADYTLWLNPYDSGWTGILLDDHCPPDTADCIAWHTSGAAFSHGITCQHLTPGTYYIMVDTWPAPDCIPAFDLAITATGTPLNDDCAGAALIAVPSTTYGTTKCATLDTIPECPGAIEAPGVWYRIVGTGNTITASLCSTETFWDSKLALFTCGCESLRCENHNDDYCGLTSHAQLSWCSRTGEVYWLLVHAEHNSMGDFRLDVQDDGVPCGFGVRCPCWHDTLTAPGQLAGSTVGASSNCSWFPYPDRVVRVEIPSAGYWNFSLCGSDFDTYLMLGTDCCLLDIATADNYFCDGDYSFNAEVCVYLPVAGYYYTTVEGMGVDETGRFILNVQPSDGFVPAQVTGVSATENLCSTVMVTWNDVVGEEGYKILSSGGYSWRALADCTHSYDYWTLPGVMHAYTVASVTACGESAQSLPDSGMAWDEVPQVTGVFATDSNCTNVFISWSDVPFEDGFKIYRNGVHVGTTGHDTVSYMDTPGTGTFGYTVRGYNNACGDGLLSAADSGIVLLMPTPVSNLTASAWYCDRVVLTWMDAQYETSYRIYRDGNPLTAHLPANTTTYTDCTAVSGVNYTYGVTTYNFCGSQQVVVSGTRLPVPPQVSNVAATDALCNGVQITWTDVAGETGYEVHRNGSIIANPLPANTAAYLDTTAVAGVAYAYIVCAFNPGCMGPYSNPDSGRRRIAPQQAPNPIIPDSCAAYNICWASVPDADGYIIRRTGILIDSVAAGVLCYSDSAVPQTHQLTVSAYNACGEGPQSPSVVVGFPVLPNVSGLTASDSLCDQVLLIWNTSLPFDSFFIYRNDTLIGRSVFASYTDLTAVPFVVYSYSVCGRSACGIGPRSAPDNGACWHVPLQVSSVTATQDRCDSVIVIWNDLAHETGYRIYVDGELTDSVGANITRYADTPTSGSHLYTVQAFNICGSGVISAPATGIRLTAPGIPSSITASDNLCSIVMLWWGDATGDVDEYRFYRDGSLIGSALPAAESFVDSAAVGRHAYTVAAFSTECGVGAQSATDSGIGHAPPAAPANLIFTSPAVCDSIQLTWQAPAGEVSMYRIWRDGFMLDTAPQTHYTDVTVNDHNEHLYAVAAINDACGDGSTSIPVIGYVLPLMEITSGLLDTVPSGRWLILDLWYCSGVDSTRFFLSLNNGPYQHLRTIFPSASDSLFFEPVSVNIPNCRLMALTRRNARTDTVISPVFVLEAASVASEMLSGVPADFFLGNNYPNPFNPSTTIRFGVPHTADVRIEVFDMLGRRVAVVLNSTLPPGVHSVVWDCSSCPSGMYVIRMQSEHRTFLGKMLLMK